MPRVAVVITCFNLGRYLPEAIESVNRQTFREFELILVDDGSTDPETIALLSSGQLSDARIIRTANRGLPAAKNLGFRSATSPYLCCLDADDRLVPAFLERSVAVIDADPSIAFVSHWLRNFGDETSEWRPETCELPAMLDANAVNGAALTRRDAFESVGGYDESLRDGYEDWDFWITLLERGYRGTIIPEVLYEYRRRPDSMTSLVRAGDRHAALYGQLARKHAATFLRYLPHLILERERRLAHARTHIHDLENEFQQWLGPDVARHRDDLAALTRKGLQRESVQFEYETVRSQLRDRTTALEVAHVRLRESEQEVTSLRKSLSWRITGPLRAAYGWLLAMRGDPR